LERTLQGSQDKKLSPASSRAKIGEARRAKMHNRLIAAGARVIADRGHEKATIDDFIRGADVSRGTFYNHFETREELLEALWATIGRDPFAEIQASCASMINPAERLAAMTRLVLRRAIIDPTWGWLIVALSAERATVNDDLRSYPGLDLQAGSQAERFRYDDLSCAIDLIVGTMRAALRALLTEGRESHYPESLCKMLLLSLGMNQIEAHRLSHMPLPTVPVTASLPAKKDKKIN
jgi:AcrR family transcriptional regulator